MKKFLYFFIAALLISHTQVSLSLSEDLPRLDLSKAMNWEDEGIVHGIGNEKAYYPSVIFDSEAFGKGSGPKYKMWYSDGEGAVRVVTSKDGKSWRKPKKNEELFGKPHHVQVIYDKECFGDCLNNNIKYKIWYWNKNFHYKIEAIGYAESQDGVYWPWSSSITQDDDNQLITGRKFKDWNTGSNGPVDVLYQPDAPNTVGSNDPWDYSYVMFFTETMATMNKPDWPIQKMA